MNPLFPLLMRLAQIQSEPVDRLALQAVLEKPGQADPERPGCFPRQVIADLVETLQLPKPRWIQGGSVDPSDCPCLIHKPDRGWALLRGRTAQNEWLTDTYDPQANRWVETPCTR